MKVWLVTVWPSGTTPQTGEPSTSIPGASACRRPSNMLLSASDMVASHVCDVVGPASGAEASGSGCCVGPESTPPSGGPGCGANSGSPPHPVVTAATTDIAAKPRHLFEMAIRSDLQS